MYDVKSAKAEEFIDHEEVMETLGFAQKNKDNIALIDSILEKARKNKGLTHREASVLLACEDPEKNEEIFRLAQQIKKDFYGNRIVMFAPLYLSDYCVNECRYCGYHHSSCMERKKLTQEEIVQAAKDYDPARINRYVITLATLFHKFYNTCRVRGEEESLTAARLALCTAVSTVIRNVLSMFKISAPESM